MSIKEVISLHIGQAGCQVGEACWEQFCGEHGIGNDGRLLGEEGEDTTWKAFFGETTSGQCVPRSVFVDTDPTSKDAINISSYKKLFHPETVIAYKQDCKSNFFEGRQMATVFRIKDDVMDRVRMAVELCDNLQGFFIFNSFGGGTGTGLGLELMVDLSDTYGKKEKFQQVIFPSNNLSSSIVEPYNCIFATHYMKEHADLAMFLDNEAAYRMCMENLKLTNPHFTNLNRLIAQIISACTGSLRYESELSATMDTIRINIVPFTEFNYALLSLAPCRCGKTAPFESVTTKEIVTRLGEAKNFLADCSSLSMNRYMAAAILLRGIEFSMDDAPASETLRQSQDPGSVNRKLEASALTPEIKMGRGHKPQPIQINAVKPAIYEMLNPKQGRPNMKFVPWMQHGGIKIGVIWKPPHIPDNWGMAKSNRQGAMISNTTAVRTLLVRQYTKFLKLFYHKAYVWQFLEAAGELDAFYEAKEGVRGIIDSYEKVLRQSVDQENQQGANARLKGQTSMGQPEDLEETSRPG